MSIINDLNELNQIISELEKDDCIVEANILNNIFIKIANNLDDDGGGIFNESFKPSQKKFKAKKLTDPTLIGTSFGEDCAECGTGKMFHFQHGHDLFCPVEGWGQEKEIIKTPRHTEIIEDNF